MLRSKKKVTASLLAACALVVGSGIAAALDLPDQAEPSVAEDKVADVEKGKPADAQANAAEHRQNLTAGDEGVDVAGVEGSEGDGERPTDTHGYEVSQLATTTELEGREKGEAISTLAKTNGGGESADHSSSAGTKGKSAEAHAAHGND